MATSRPWCVVSNLALNVFDNIGLCWICPCGETQTMSHTVNSCTLMTLEDGLSRLLQMMIWYSGWLTLQGKTHMRN